jgi:hypothetical protein
MIIVNPYVYPCLSQGSRNGLFSQVAIQKKGEGD